MLLLLFLILHLLLLLPLPFLFRLRLYIQTSDHLLCMQTPDQLLKALAKVLLAEAAKFSFSLACSLSSLVPSGAVVALCTQSSVEQWYKNLSLLSLLCSLWCQVEEKQKKTKKTKFQKTKETKVYKKMILCFFLFLTFCFFGFCFFIFFGLTLPLLSLLPLPLLLLLLGSTT